MEISRSEGRDGGGHPAIRGAGGPAPDTVVGVRTPVAVSLLVASLLALAGCAVPPKAQEPAGDGVAVGTVPDGFGDYYGQTLDWEACGDGFECATARAPLDWSDPGSDEIELAVKRKPASGDAIGSLFTNPGGPGGSGTDSLDFMMSSISREVTEVYDVVSWDPRGVETSAAVVCLDDEDKDRVLSEDFPDDEAGLAALASAYADWAEACEENSGDLLAHVDTQSTARDLDMLRAVVGDESLAYLGYSYGTELGATYAGLFPQNAGRLVLDGAIDVTLTPDESTEQQAQGFESALRAYVEDCQAGRGCPLTGSVQDGLNQITTLLDQAFEHPLATGDPDRPLTSSLAFTGIAVTMYDDESWSYLTMALDEAINERDGTTLLYLADVYNDRESGGSFDGNSAEAFRAVNCLDAPQDADPKSMEEQVERLAKDAPTVGEFFAYGGLVCAQWPYPAVERDFDVSAPGAAPIVVIGTTNDPATPYVGAQALAKTLDSGVLVTFEGEGHTAYGRSNSCIADAVDGFLIDGSVPKDGLTC